jgi:group I intron endonuclease
MADAILADLEKSGIYQIRNLVNGKRYVGSAVNIRARWASHRYYLRSGKHHSDHLQSAWNKYGEDSFEFSVVEFCAREELLAREQFHIDCGCDYNKSPTAGSPLGVKWSKEARDNVSRLRSGVPKSKAHVEKMRQYAVRQWADPQIREKMSSGVARSYADQDLIETRRKVMNRSWADPEISRKMREGIRQSYTDELRSLRSAQSKARWADPEFRRRMTEIRRNRSK